MERLATECVPELLLTSVSNLEDADRLARLLVENRLAACVQITPQVISWYHWQDDMERSSECVLSAKISSAVREMAIAFVKEHHPYELPEILVVPVRAGSKAYFDWLFAQLGGERRRQSEVAVSTLAPSQGEGLQGEPQDFPVSPSWHIFLHACTCGPSDPSKLEILPQFETTFDEFLKHLSAESNAYVEPDGSFSLSGQAPAFWRLDGQMTEYDGKLAHIELKGWAPQSEMKKLLNLLNTSEPGAAVQIAPKGVFHPFATWSASQE